MTSTAEKKSVLTVRELVYIALFAVLIVVCSWIAVPTPMGIPVTLQTFAIFLALGLLGGKRGTLSVIVYILLGVVGLPVFSGFRGGAGVILGTTGGYIIGFIFSALLFWLITAKLGRKTFIIIIAMVLGLIVCYAFGTAWFVIMYTNTTGPIGIIGALSSCVFPFIIPDVIKIALAVLLTNRLSPRLKI
ncbi:MAG: biotin transporter BioY [Clostridia bacterium]|nr:biotin transporter BioY [Clostridia bacterium]MBQ1375629.1 biotin transporter BioY [Clostridia bacterium]MBQ1434622.1 biotin transporter BioY [Clostridia bacterium]MBQ4249732.1 biotin transporter BioY [Clostridia bacterium]